MVAGHFLYINFITDCPTMSNCGARCWEQAGEEQIIPCKSKLAACGSGESSAVEGLCSSYCTHILSLESRIHSSVLEGRESSRKRE